MKLIALALPLALLFATPALAQEAEQAPDRVTYKQKTLVEFSNLEVSGKVVRPDTAYVHSRGSARFASLIRLRASFRPELEASLDAL